MSLYMGHLVRVWGYSILVWGSYIAMFSYILYSCDACACMDGSYMQSIKVCIYILYGATLSMKASQHYPNMIQQAIVHVYGTRGPPLFTILYSFLENSTENLNFTIFKYHFSNFENSSVNFCVE